jgi:hypothetical protein
MRAHERHDVVAEGLPDARAASCSVEATQASSAGASRAMGAARWRAAPTDGNVVDGDDASGEGHAIGSASCSPRGFAALPDGAEA